MHPAKIHRFIIMAIVLLVYTASICWAVPPEINYQGMLTDSNGNPVTEASIQMQFVIYDAAEGGLDLWNETQSVSVEEGIFNVRLGAVTPLTAGLFDGNRFLGITVEAGTEMTPRHVLVSVPYALTAENANHAQTATYADILLNGTATGDFFIDGDVGIGTETPESPLHIESMGGIDLIIEADTNNSGGEDQNARVVLRQDGGQVSGRMGYRHEENDLEIMQEYYDDLIFGTNNSDRMTIKGDGKIGIGTSSPEAKLHVEMLSGHSIPSTLAGLVIRDGTFNSANQVEIQDDQGNARVVVDSAGQVGIGTATPGTALTVRGNVTVLSEATGVLILELGEGLDYAEGFDVTNETLGPGTVLAIDEKNPGHLTMSKSAYDRKVAGIVAGAKGLGSGVRLGGQQFDQDVALAGRVYCMVEAVSGKVLPGDLLTTSNVSGHAMKVMDYSRAQGAVLGKAMEPLEKGEKGLILVLVTLQ